MKTRLLLVLLVLLCWVGWSLPGRSQTGTGLQLESRVDRLESELSRLRSRLNQLETRSGGVRPTPTIPSGAPSPLNELTLEEQFDNLATLAIELKQDLRQLEARVADLEADRAP